MDSSLGVIAITEHNDVSWVDLLRRPAKRSNLLIFPGFEIASSEGVHVLCLWEPSEEVSRLDEILVEAGLPTTGRWHRDGTPRMSRLQLQDLVAFVHERGGLCILSHVDREDGVLHRLTGEPRIRAWLESGALAVQCSKNPRLMDDGSFYRRVLVNEGDQYRRDRPYACIQTSDARALDEIGSKPTFIKMSSDSIEGLRQAFLDSKSRIRFPDEHDIHSYPRILAAQWDGCFLEAQFPFNSNLNCLIGGKGTAKSTVIETIRHAFGMTIESDAVRDQAASLLTEIFPSSAKISLLLEVPTPRPTRYVLERTGNDRPIVRSADTQEILDGLAPTTLCRPIIFGQREIYETAMRLESQLSLLDGYCASELEPLFSRERSLVKDIGLKSHEARQIEEELAGLGDRLAELPALRERKRLFDEAGLADKLAEQRELERERATLKTAEEILIEHRDLVQEIERRASRIASIEPLAEQTPNAELIAALHELAGEVMGAWTTSLQALGRALDKAEKRFAVIQGEWRNRFEERRAAFDTAVLEVAGEHGESNIRDYVQLDAKIDRLAALETQRKNRRKDLKGIVGTRRELVAELREVRRQIFLVRNAKAVELTNELGGAVQVEVRHQGNRDRVVKALRNLRSGAGNRQIQELVDRDDFSAARLAELLRHSADAVSTEYAVPEGAAQQLVRAAAPLKIDELEVLALDDLVQISLNVGDADRADFRPLDRLSAGQRSTAILLLALLESDGPLILDQPEDDLDNRFIYDDVVRRLREAKEKRQFLIATHNANIPVLGDAEQIVVLDTYVENDLVRAAVAARGSIDDAPLHGPVEDVLEGGREAFERRKEKYGF